MKKTLKHCPSELEWRYGMNKQQIHNMWNADPWRRAIHLITNLKKIGKPEPIRATTN